MEERFGPVHLRLTGAFFGEVGVMLEKLCFYGFEGGVEILFFLIIRPFTSSNSAIDAPVGIVSSECVFVGTAAAFLCRVVGGKVGNALHAHLCSERFAVAQVGFQAFPVLDLLNNGLSAC